MTVSDYEPGLYTTIGLLPATISATPESTVVANGISASLFTFMLEIGCSRFRIASSSRTAPGLISVVSDNTRHQENETHALHSSS